MRPIGDHLRILWVLRRALARRDVRAMCNQHDIGSTTIYQATSPERGNPSLAVLCRIINAMGYELVVRPKRWSVRPPEGFPRPLSAADKAEQDALVAAAGVGP